MKQQRKIDIDEFLAVLDKLITSKYILAERKISDVLVQVAKTTHVYNLIAKCMINFDFKAEWKIATSAHFFKLPESDEKRVAFIFCLLSNIDDKNIDFTNLISQYFSTENSFSAYELFSKTVIVEFKRLIIKLLNIEEDNESDYEILEKECESQNNFILLERLVTDICVKIKSSEKLKRCFLTRNDLIAVLSTLLLVTQQKQTEYLYAFRVTLNAALAKNKNYKNEIERINQVIDQIIRGVYE